MQQVAFTSIKIMQTLFSINVILAEMELGKINL